MEGPISAIAGAFEGLELKVSKLRDTVADQACEIAKLKRENARLAGEVQRQKNHNTKLTQAVAEQRKLVKHYQEGALSLHDDALLQRAQKRAEAAEQAIDSLKADLREWIDWARAVIPAGNTYSSEPMGQVGMRRTISTMLAVSRADAETAHVAGNTAGQWYAWASNVLGVPPHGYTIQVLQDGVSERVRSGDDARRHLATWRAWAEELWRAWAKELLKTRAMGDVDARQAIARLVHDERKNAERFDTERAVQERKRIEADRHLSEWSSWAYALLGTGQPMISEKLRDTVATRFREAEAAAKLVRDLGEAVARAIGKT